MDEDSTDYSSEVIFVSKLFEGFFNLPHISGEDDRIFMKRSLDKKVSLNFGSRPDYGYGLKIRTGFAYAVGMLLLCLLI